MLNDLWKFFASVKLTVITLLIIALASIIGTFKPQIDIYHSLFFQALLILLTLNIFVCSYDRIPAVWKIVFVKKPPFNRTRFNKVKQKKEFNEKRSVKTLEKTYASFVSKHYTYSRTEKTDEGVCIFAEKWRWTRFGVYIVHLSIILLLLGSLISFRYGFEGFVEIAEGESASQIRFRNTNQIYDLGFEVRCDDFNVSFYDESERMPKEFRSSLTILEDGKPVLQKDIIVNNPLRYKGISFFQNTYGKRPANISTENITLSFQSRETQMQYTEKAGLKQPIELPEGKGRFVIEEYTDAALFGEHPLGEAFTGTLTKKDGSKSEIILPLRYPSFDRMRHGDMVISVVDLPFIYTTGLQVTKDPGVVVVYSGFIILIIGIVITFFMTHQRICIDVRKKKGGSIVLVSGTSNRNTVGMQNHMNRLSDILMKL